MKTPRRMPRGELSGVSYPHRVGGFRHAPVVYHSPPPSSSSFAVDPLALGFPWPRELSR